MKPDFLKNLSWSGVTGSGMISLRMPVERVGEMPRVERKQLAVSTGSPSTGSGSGSELEPKESDYVRFKFRAISARYLGEEGYYLDFSRPGVLQASMPLMLPLSAGGTRRVHLKFHRNHSRRIEDVIGLVEANEWGDVTEKQSAPGINITVPIDIMLGPMEIRRLLSTPPLVDSVSISFYGKFEKSHPDLDDWQFREMLGREIDGSVVRLIVTQIDAYDHVGLVYEGADEEADKLEESGKQQKENGNQIIGDGNMEFRLDAKILASICAALGVDTIASPAELLEGLETLAESNADLQKKIAGFKARAEAFDAILKTRRDDLKALIGKVDASPAMLKVVDIADLETLAELEKEYSAKLEEKFPLKCEKCGHAGAQRRSSVEEPPAPSTGSGTGNSSATINPANFRA